MNFVPERAEVTQDLAAVLPPEHELFAVYVSSGLSYRESARRAEFHASRETTASP